MAYDRYDDRDIRGYRGDRQRDDRSGGRNEERGFFDRAIDSVSNFFSDDDSGSRSNQGHGYNRAANNYDPNAGERGGGYSRSGSSYQPRAYDQDESRQRGGRDDDRSGNSDRGAFFGSILGTLSHLLWADRMWLSRCAGLPRPPVGLSGSATLVTDAAAWAEGRRGADADWLAWAERLEPRDLDGDLTWVSGVTGGTVSRPWGLIATHVFNHQTHHRGQVHAMLTAAGLRPRDTDLFLMPAQGTPT